jgi:hypothetical protein
MANRSTYPKHRAATAMPDVPLLPDHGRPERPGYLRSEFAADIGPRDPMDYRAARHVSLSFLVGPLSVKRLFPLQDGKHAARCAITRHF